MFTVQSQAHSHPWTSPHLSSSFLLPSPVCLLHVATCSRRRSFFDLYSYSYLCSHCPYMHNRICVRIHGFPFPFLRSPFSVLCSPFVHTTTSHTPSVLPNLPISQSPDLVSLFPLPRSRLPHILCTPCTVCISFACLLVCLVPPCFCSPFSYAFVLCLLFSRSPFLFCSFPVHSFCPACCACHNRRQYVGPSYTGSQSSCCLRPNIVCSVSYDH